MKANNLIYSLTFVLLSIFSIYSAYSQPQTYREEITVIAPYEPTISDAFKINLRAQTGDTLPEKKSFTYEIRSSILATPFEVQALKPARLLGEPLEKLYKNYLRAGFGNYVSPLLEYHYNSLRSKDLNYGLRLKHLSSGGKIKDYAYPGTSNNELGFYIHRIGKKGNTITSQINYQRDVVHFYGFKPSLLEIEPDRDDYKQRYSEVGANLRWFSYDSDKDKLKHSTGLSFSHLSDKFDSREMMLKMDAGIEKSLKVFDFSDEQEFALDVEAEYYNNTILDSNMGGSAIVALQPSIHSNINEFEITLGARIDLAADSTTYVAISPIAEIRIHVLESALNIYFGTKGGIYRNSLHYYKGLNPFISDQVPLGFRNEKYRFYGGVEGRLGQRFSFNANINASKQENMAFFVNDTSYSPASRFTAVLDDVNIFSVEGTFVYQQSKKWKARALINFNQYSVAENLAWHLPELKGSIALSYNLKDKLIFETEIFAESTRKARIFNESGLVQEQDLKGFVDINLSAEYRYSKLLSAFIHLNNLSANKYERWLDYPTQGLRVMAGVSYSF